MCLSSFVPELGILSGWAFVVWLLQF